MKTFCSFVIFGLVNILILIITTNSNNMHKLVQMKTLKMHHLLNFCLKQRGEKAISYEE